MTLTYGFFNSSSGDRVYDALQLSQIFDGIIFDGVYESVGNHLEVTADTAMNILVGSGRAWFQHTWTLNDASLSLTVPAADPLLPRIDIVYLEVDHNTGVRANDIDVMEGTPASSPVPPTLTQSGNLWQYPLAEIYVGAAVTVITSGNITVKVGTDDCPFVTGPISGNIINHDHTSGLGGPLGDNVILTNNIIAEGVTTAKIDDYAVTSDKLGNDSVIAAKIADGAVDTTELATDAITTSKIVNSAVNSAKIANRTRRHPVQFWANEDVGSQVMEYSGLMMPGTLDGYLVYGFHVPSDWASGGKVVIVGYPSTGGSDWYMRNRCKYGSIGQSEVTHNDSIGYVQVGTLVSGVYKNVLDLTLTNVSAGDIVAGELHRDGNDGNDGNNASMYVVAIYFEYTADS